MATATRDVPFTKSAYVKQTAPNTVFPTDSSTAYLISTDDGNSNSYKRMYFGGANTWPDSLKRNKILSASLRLYVRAGYALGIYAFTCEDFDPAQVTYYSHPNVSNYEAYRSASDAGISPGSWGLIWLPFEERAASWQPNAAVELLKKGAFQIYSGYWTSNLGDTPWYIRTVLSDGTAPFVRIEYDDAVIITSQVGFTSKGKLPSNVNPRSAVTVSWLLGSAGGGRCVDETWEQASAVFLWRAADTWHEIQVNSSEMSLTIPPYTFPTGKTIDYKVRCTDTDGTTTETDVFRFTTPPSQITPQNSPTSGYMNPREDIVFSWYFSNTAGNYPQQSASLFWRTAGTETWTEIPADGSTQSVTVPANTFPISSTIEWYLSGTDSSGSASQTVVYSFSTTASTAYATVSSPINSVEDGSAPITFRWTLQSADGLQMSLVNLWWKLPSEGNNQWHVIKSSTDVITEWTVDAGYFPAGEIEWLVHAYNIDGTRGPDSKASFICVDAPDPVRGLTATAVPLTTISWQSEGQEAYEISIDGEVVKKSYGVGVYSWSVPEPLSEGEHAISVRIQGIYGLWSQPAETSIMVGGPTSQPSLAGEFGADAVLTTDISDPDATVRYYRDGVLIGTAPAGAPFVDRYAVGAHEYFARTFVAQDGVSGHYTQTNIVTGSMNIRTPIISALAGGPWISMRLTEESSRKESFGWSKTVAHIHVTGAKYPVLEMSPYEDLSGSFTCAFWTEEDARAFEGLRGKVVILKTRRASVLVGVLNQLQKTVKRFYTSYSFTLQQIDWEDFVSYDA